MLQTNFKNEMNKKNVSVANEKKNQFIYLPIIWAYHNLTIWQFRCFEDI